MAIKLHGYHFHYNLTDLQMYGEYGVSVSLYHVCAPSENIASMWSMEIVPSPTYGTSSGFLSLPLCVCGLNLVSFLAVVWVSVFCGGRRFLTTKNNN